MFNRGLCLALALSFSSLAMAQTDTSEYSMRQFRSWAVSGEIGFNSLASLAGLAVSYYPKRNLGLDLGAGLISVGGTRPGVRIRYLFTPLEDVSFFAGLGYKYGTGSFEEEVEVEDPDTKDKLKMKIDPSSFLDGMLGFEYLADNGFLLIANCGYSQLLSGKYYSVTSGTLSKKGKEAFDLAFGSGIMLSVSLGMAF